jgi:hypothetical protein
LFCGAKVVAARREAEHAVAGAAVRGAGGEYDVNVGAGPFGRWDREEVGGQVFVASPLSV